MRSFLWLIFLVGCIPDGGPPTGTGTSSNGASLSIDASSTFVLQRRESCTVLDHSVFAISYGNGKFGVRFQIDGGPSVFADITYKIPAEAGSHLTFFNATPATPTFVSGTLKAGITGLLGRRDGDLHVTFADGSIFDGHYDLPFDAEGPNVHCGGGGVGGGDEWD